MATENEMRSIEEVTLSGKIDSYIVDPGSGEQIACKYKDPKPETKRKLAELEERAQEEGDEDAAEELEEIVCDDLFLSEKVSSDSGLAIKQAVIAGLFRGLGTNDAVSDAQELMEDLSEGNQ